MTAGIGPQRLSRLDKDGGRTYGPARRDGRPVGSPPQAGHARRLANRIRMSSCD